MGTPSRTTVAGPASLSTRQVALAASRPPRAVPLRRRALRCQADASRTLEPTVPAAVPVGTGGEPLEVTQSRLEQALETYAYKRADEAPTEDAVLALQRKLEAIGRELAAVSPEEHVRLSRATHTASTTVGASPLLQIGLAAPAPPAAPAAPAQQRNSIVPLVLPGLLGKPAGGDGAAKHEPRPEGTGREVLLQGFNWESWKHGGGWYNHLAAQAEEIAGMGFTAVWLPPPTQSVSNEGYMPGDLYNLNSRYGSEADLLRCVAALKGHGLKVVADAVLNHRCAQRQDETGCWNLYGGRMAWDQRAIVAERQRRAPVLRRPLSPAPPPAPAQDFVKRDLCEWLAWMRAHAGFDGFRLDFVKGFHGAHVKDYMEAAQPLFAVGEYWDGLSYPTPERAHPNPLPGWRGPDCRYDWSGTPAHDQDQHRQRTINWINAAGGLSTAFDITTKARGIMHAVFERCEYWRLSDSKGKPPGLMGWWPSRAVTFLENHDTVGWAGLCCGWEEEGPSVARGSSQRHWPFPGHALEQGYAYILTHPGTPAVFYDHVFHDGRLRHTVARLIALRAAAGVHCRSEVKILRADRDVYAAEVDGRICAKIGPGDFKPGPSWSIVECGPAWCVWAKQ
eukprot:scaffold3.g6587.t1